MKPRNRESYARHRPPGTGSATNRMPHFPPVWSLPMAEPPHLYRTDLGACATPSPPGVARLDVLDQQRHVAGAAHFDVGGAAVAFVALRHFERAWKLSRSACAVLHRGDGQKFTRSFTRTWCTLRPCRARREPGVFDLQHTIRHQSTIVATKWRVFRRYRRALAAAPRPRGRAIDETDPGGSRPSDMFEELLRDKPYLTTGDLALNSARRFHVQHRWNVR